MSRQPDTGRRRFLLAMGRSALALLLGGGIGALIARDGEECTPRGMCRGCAVLDTCHLPEALAARRAGRGKRG
ncbi:MAG: hypothetical protein PVJ27_10130 [Candidatus Brocadiaceae bacterium]